MYSTKCDKCGKSGRLHVCCAGDWGNEEGKENILICDDCFEQITDWVACCEDYCSLLPDHLGVCQE
jgi:hypothetical protein